MSNKNSRVTPLPDFLPALNWFKKKGWTPFEFQLDAWRCYLEGFHGLVNAPTGSGKTYSLLIPALLECMRKQASTKFKRHSGLQVIWITPIRALSKEIEFSAKQAIEGLGLSWRVGVRSGDTSAKERVKQKKSTHAKNALTRGLRLMQNDSVLTA